MADVLERLVANTLRLMAYLRGAPKTCTCGRTNPINGAIFSVLVERLEEDARSVVKAQCSRDLRDISRWTFIEIYDIDNDDNDPGEDK
jgi:hypothetical protein